MNLRMRSSIVFFPSTNEGESAMRRYCCIAMSLWAGILTATGCGNDETQAKLQSCAAENARLQTENGGLRSQLGELHTEVENLRRRKDVIYTVKMVVDFSGFQGPMSPNGGPTTSFLTEAKLASRDGKTYRMLGRNSPTSPTQGVPELIFEPIDTSQWTALRIAELSRLQTLTLDFPASFNAAGIAWGDAPHLHAIFEVNSIQVADLDTSIDAAAAKAGLPLTWNVDKTFEHVSEEYTKQLNQHAG